MRKSKQNNMILGDFPKESLKKRDQLSEKIAIRASGIKYVLDEKDTIISTHFIDS